MRKFLVTLLLIVLLALAASPAFAAPPSPGCKGIDNAHQRVIAAHVSAGLNHFEINHQVFVRLLGGDHPSGHHCGH